MSLLTCKGYLIDPEASFKNPELVFNSHDKPYSCILNQTDLKTNANKFYRMQIIKDGNDYHLFTRYGRIGEKGKTIDEVWSLEDKAIHEFQSKFRSKTGNNWEDDDFKIKVGKYYMTSSGEKIHNKDLVTTPVPRLPSKFHNDVSKFLSLISDREMLQSSMVKMDIDIAKMPLGKINVSQIEKAKNLLLDLQKNLSVLSEDDILDISSKYYTYVPYACGRKIPPTISTPEKISSLLDHLEDLQNISLNVEVIEKSSSDIDPLETLYESLGTKISHIPASTEIYNLIEKYMMNTHGSSHHFKLKLLSVLEIDKPKFKKAYSERFSSLENKELLIHGSRMCNWVSILKNGLLLDPSKIGAVITGKMFGYGIYWANSFSKSAQYCGHSRSSKSEIVCFTLAEVALGNQLKLKNAESSMTWDNLRKRGDYHSTYGEGINTPKEFSKYESFDIPTGKLGKRLETGYSLQYDEKIVYNADQFDMRYMVIAEMTY